MVSLINETISIKYKAGGILSMAFGFTFFMYFISILIPFLIVFSGSGYLKIKLDFWSGYKFSLQQPDVNFQNIYISGNNQKGQSLIYNTFQEMSLV